MRFENPIVAIKQVPAAGNDKAYQRTHVSSSQPEPPTFQVLITCCLASSLLVGAIVALVSRSVLGELNGMRLVARNTSRHTGLSTTLII